MQNGASLNWEIDIRLIEKIRCIALVQKPIKMVLFPQWPINSLTHRLAARQNITKSKLIPTIKKRRSNKEIIEIATNIIEIEDNKII